ncbi:MAG: hypothetical protein Q9222_003003 [Ikaeria aurantiellina]
MGLLACIAGSVRIVYLASLRHSDLTISMADEYLWSQMEPAVAILCACVVTYRPLLVNHDFSRFSRIPLFLGRSKGSNSSGSEQDGDLDRDLQYEWPAAQGLNTAMTYQDLHSRVSKHGPCILNIQHEKRDSGTTATIRTTGAMDQSWSQKSQKKQNAYKTPALTLTHENEVVADPWA